MSEPAIRVVVSDDHPVVRQGLRSLLEAEGFAVVGEASDPGRGTTVELRLPA
jgi:DNA-binding NarL/FixJ family response regulator